MAKPAVDEINRKRFTVKFSQAQKEALEKKGFKLSEGCNKALEIFLDKPYESEELKALNKYNFNQEQIIKRLDRIEKQRNTR